jgi:hypothetical protein
MRLDGKGGGALVQPGTAARERFQDGVVGTIWPWKLGVNFTSRSLHQLAIHATIKHK